MTAMVRLGSEYVYKRFDDPDRATLAAARAATLRDAGVTTPCAARSRHGRLVRFPRIVGVDGLEVLRAAHPSVLSALLSPVVHLHGSKPSGTLEPFDPLAKILPRIGPAEKVGLLPFFERARGEIAVTSPLRAPIHGDLHARQLVLDGTGTAWLLDLDDLAAGDPAADLGNFAAHLATSEPLPPSAPVATLRTRLGRVLEAYAMAGGSADALRADAYGRLALVRRALKLRERGDPRLLALLAAADARGSSARP